MCTRQEGIGILCSRLISGGGMRNNVYIIRLQSISNQPVVAIMIMIDKAYYGQKFRSRSVGLIAQII